MIPESELAGAGSKGARGGSRHVGLKVLIVVLALAVVAAGCLVFAYFRGYGIPSQEAAIESLFGGDGTAAAWSSSVSSEARAQAMSGVQTGGSYEIAGMDASTNECVAIVSAKLPEGGVISYTVSLIREGLGWKVSNVEQIRPAVTQDTFTGAL